MTPDKTSADMPDEIWIEGRVTPRGYFCVEMWSKKPFECPMLTGNARAKYVRTPPAPVEEIEGLQEAIEAADHALFEGDAWPIMRQGHLETLRDAARAYLAASKGRG